MFRLYTQKRRKFALITVVGFWTTQEYVISRTHAFCIYDNPHGYHTSIDVSVLTAYYPYSLKLSRFHKQDNIVTLKRFPYVGLSTAF